MEQDELDADLLRRFCTREGSVLKATLPETLCQVMTATTPQKLWVAQKIEWSVCSPAEGLAANDLKHQLPARQSCDSPAIIPYPWHEPWPCDRANANSLYGASRGNKLEFSCWRSLNVMTGCSPFRKWCNSHIWHCCYSRALAHFRLFMQCKGQRRWWWSLHQDLISVSGNDLASLLVFVRA